MLDLQIGNLDFIKFCKHLKRSNQNIELNVFNYIPAKDDKIKTLGEDLLLEN